VWVENAAVEQRMAGELDRWVRGEEPRYEVVGTAMATAIATVA
jgi:hypothetical protein